jgi:hypothetical protein
VSGLVVSHDESTVVMTTRIRDGSRGRMTGALLRIIEIASDRVEVHAVGPTGFFSLVPWPEGRFALIRQPIDGPDAPEADALVAQGKLPRVIIRGFEDPLTDIAVARITADDRLELAGDSSAWDVPPSLVPMDGPFRARWDFPLVLRLHGGDVEMHRVQVVPPPDRGDGDDYRLTPLGDGRTVLLSHRRYGDELLAVDVVEDAVTARTALGGVSPSAIEYLPQRNEVWIGQLDQLLRFDPARMAVTNAVRLRNDRSGSFINALRCDTSESRCAVSYALRSRDPRGPWAAPSGGRILLFDVDSFRLVGSVEAPGWVDDLALMSNDRVCGRINFEMWLGQIAAAQHPLYPPRRLGERNWM